jgi:hypothetical protein
MKKKDKPFELPKSFLTQLEEFTCGFHLVTINEAGDFSTYVFYPNKLTELGLVNYMDIQSTTVQEVIRQKTVENQLFDEDEEDSGPVI